MGDHGHNGHGPKRWGLLHPFRGGELAPHLTQCGLGRGLLPYQTKWCLHPSSSLATTDIGQKLGGCGCAPLLEREL